MAGSNSPSDMELAALIASKICHDLVGPVGAIYNGLEVLEMDSDDQSRDYALDVIRDFTTQASAKVQFARFAYGAAGTAGSQVDLSSAESIARGFVGEAKHKLIWSGPVGYMAKDKVKLLLNLVECSLQALPKGGTVNVAISGTLEAPVFQIRCVGSNTRPPQHLPDFLAGKPVAIDALNIHAYYTCRLAQSCEMLLDVSSDGADIVLAARQG